MSDDLNEFDELFREKLSGQEVTPPPTVWENIQSERNFGHVVANKISNNWNIFGTLLMLLLAGGTSFLLFSEDQKQYETIALFNDEDPLNEMAVEPMEEEKETLSKIKAENAQTIQRFSEKDQNEFRIPDGELVASIYQSGFARPRIEDERLSAYVEELEGWGTAKPKSFVRYLQMEPTKKLSVHKNTFSPGVEEAEKIEYDYVMPRVERKTFRERASLLLSFTPQTVTKIMSAEYNLSSSYLEQRAKSESTRMAYTFEANLHYELKNHKFFETGLNFTQIYEEMSFEGDKQFSNQYDFIEIPLLLGYQDRNAKWGWHLKGGLGVQVFNNYKGFILKRVDPNAPDVAPSSSSNGSEREYRMSKSSAVRNIISNNHSLSQQQDPNEVLDLENEEENPYKSSGVVNVHLAAGLTYYHSIKTTFVLTPYFRRSVNSITKERSLFNERLSYMGISFGTRLKF